MTKVNTNEKKRVYSKFMTHQKDNLNGNPIIMLHDILILEVFINNLEFTDAYLLSNIVKKCKALIKNPKENLFTAKMLLRKIYFNLIKTLENPKCFNKN